MVLLDLPNAKALFRGGFRETRVDLNVVHHNENPAPLGPARMVAAGFGYSILNICASRPRTDRTAYNRATHAAHLAGGYGPNSGCRLYARLGAADHP